MTAATNEAQLKSFIDKFSPEQQRKIRAIRKAMRSRFPGANELVYDNYNFFVIGYGPTEKPSECLISIAAQAKAVSLCLLHGSKLKDPDGLLRGTGKLNRSVRLESAASLDEPGISALLDAAVAQSPFATKGGKLIIRSVSEKQRPRK